MNIGYTLVLNMGLKSIRSIVFDADGNKLAFSSMPLNTFIKADWVTQDAEEWWEKAVHVIRETLHDPEIRDRLQFMTVTTSAACLVPVDESSTPLCPVIMVSDKRAIREGQHLASVPEFRAVAERTGLKADPYLMIPKIMWVKNNLPDVFARTYRFLSPNDYLLARLTGVFVTDHFNAEKYHYDTQRGCYPVELLRSLGIDPSTMPTVVSPGTPVAPLAQSAQSLFGLRQEVHAVATTYDAIAAFYGSGPEYEEAADVSGTVTSVRALSRTPLIDPLNRVFSTPFIDYGHYVVGGSNNLGGGLIEWVKQCYYQNDVVPYEIMEKDARESGVGANGLVFLPYLLGERAPLWDHNARGVFFGLERTHTRKDMTRAVFESTGFATLALLDVLQDHGLEVKRIRSSGGLARVHLISQIKADVSGREVLVLDEFETTALGAAIMVGVGQGLHRDYSEASRRMVNVRMIIRPNQKNHDRYKAMYRLYHRVYAALKPVFAERIDIVSQLYRNAETRIENL